MSRLGTIDNLDFARRGMVQEGELGTADLGRAADLIDRAAVRFRLQGFIGPRGEPRLALHLAGVLQLQCQRCLAPLDWPIDGDAEFVLRAAAATGEVEIAPEDMAADAPDVLPIGRAMSVQELVEDEVILAIPIAPMHTRCSPPGATA